MRRALLAALLLVMLAGPDGVAAATRWGWLGVRIRDLSEQEMEEISQKHGLREGFGAMIVEVMKETPAELAGLRSGDLVVAFKDRLVVDTRTLQRLVAAAGVGETVTLTVLRRELGRRPVEVRIGLMPDPVAADRVAAEFGFSVREPEPLAERAGARPPGVPAVAVVLPRTRADTAGLKVGDVLVEVNGAAVATVEAVREALLTVSENGPLPIVVQRNGDRVTLRLPGAPPP